MWCGDASPAMVARLARLGFDWVCLDTQHGGYSRTEIIDAARSFPSGLADLVVRVPSCDFAAIGAALDAGARAVIVPQIESAADAAACSCCNLLPADRCTKLGPARPHVGRYDAHGRGGQQQHTLRCDDRVGLRTCSRRGDRGGGWSRSAVRRAVRPLPLSWYDGAGAAR